MCQQSAREARERSDVTFEGADAGGNLQHTCKPREKKKGESFSPLFSRSNEQRTPVVLSTALPVSYSFTNYSPGGRGLLQRVAFVCARDLCPLLDPPGHGITAPATAHSAFQVTVSGPLCGLCFAFFPFLFMWGTAAVPTLLSRLLPAFVAGPSCS